MSDRPHRDPRNETLARQYKAGPPVRVMPLEYYGGSDEPSQPRVPGVVQFLLGLAFPIAYATAAVAILRDRVFMFIPVHLGLIVAISLIVRLKWQWRGFIPGVLTTILIAPVAVFVLCCIAIGSSLGR